MIEILLDEMLAAHQDELEAKLRDVGPPISYGDTLKPPPEWWIKAQGEAIDAILTERAFSYWGA